MSFPAAGFVLAGGRSSRMGRDKALLTLRGETLIEIAVKKLGELCAEVAIAGGVGTLERYGRVIADGVAGCGPLGGIVAALEQTDFDWNLVLAVDVPFVPVDLLRGLLRRAEEIGEGCVMPRMAGRAEPLCAAYHRRTGVGLRTALAAGRYRVQAAAESVCGVEYMDVAEEHAGWFRNLNTPGDLAEAGGIARSEDQDLSRLAGASSARSDGRCETL